MHFRIAELIYLAPLVIVACAALAALSRDQRKVRAAILVSQVVGVLAGAALLAVSWHFFSLASAGRAREYVFDTNAMWKGTLMATPVILLLSALPRLTARLRKRSAADEASLPPNSQ